jgi:long-chain fatty acid transport protein
LAAEIDWSRTGWSNFEEILVTSAATGAVLSRSENYWDDSNAYRLGLTYDLNPDTQLRFGYTYDETGQPDEYYTARIPDVDRQTFSIGAAHSLGDGWELEGGYMYVTWDDNNYQGTRAFNPLVNTDINGTTALAGDYEAHAHIFGIGVNKSF